MKKSLLFLGLLPFLAVAGFAQESRQDVSLSGLGYVQPFVTGNAVQQHSNAGFGGLASYRYMLTPRSALEVNYSYNQYFNHFTTSAQDQMAHTRMQEISGAYVFNFNFRRYNPFVEAGVGGFIYSPINDSGTTSFDFKRNTNIGALYGAGIAYELSPSFDLRVEYRGLIVKAPNFNYDNFKTNRYMNANAPVIGLAYHF